MSRRPLSLFAAAASAAMLVLVACVGEDPGAKETPDNDGGNNNSETGVPSNLDAGAPITDDSGDGGTGYCATQAPRPFVFCEDFDRGQPGPEWTYEITDAGGFGVTFENGMMRATGGNPAGENKARMTRIATSLVTTNRFILETDMRIEKLDPPHNDISVLGFGFDGMTRAGALHITATGNGQLQVDSDGIVKKGSEFVFPPNGRIHVTFQVERTGSKCKVSILIGGLIVSTADDVPLPATVHKVALGILTSFVGTTEMVFDNLVFRTE